MSDDIWRNHSSSVEDILCHGSAVAYDGHAVLILGPSGSGKSTLSLHLMALGCDLIADDRVWVSRGPGGLMARAPALLEGKIEAHGIGVLTSPFVRQSSIMFAVDVTNRGNVRCPRLQRTHVLGQEVSVVTPAATESLAPALLHILRNGLQSVETG